GGSLRTITSAVCHAVRPSAAVVRGGSLCGYGKMARSTVQANVIATRRSPHVEVVMARPRRWVVLGLIAATASPALATPPPIPTPEQIWDEAVAAAATELEQCRTAATAKHVYGDVRMRVYSERRWTMSPSRSLGPHGAELAACVRRAIGKYFQLYGD